MTDFKKAFEKSKQAALRDMNEFALLYASTVEFKDAFVYILDGADRDCDPCQDPCYAVVIFECMRQFHEIEERANDFLLVEDGRAALLAFCDFLMHNDILYHQDIKMGIIETIALDMRKCNLLLQVIGRTVLNNLSSLTRETYLPLNQFKRQMIKNACMNFFDALSECSENKGREMSLFESLNIVDLKKILENLSVSELRDPYTDAFIRGVLSKTT